MGLIPGRLQHIRNLFLDLIRCPGCRYPARDWRPGPCKIEVDVTRALLLASFDVESASCHLHLIRSSCYTQLPPLLDLPFWEDTLDTCLESPRMA